MATGSVHLERAVHQSSESDKGLKATCRANVDSHAMSTLCSNGLTARLTLCLHHAAVTGFPAWN